jgi:integrating conjugative element protein (TIGR03757 family)
VSARPLRRGRLLPAAILALLAAPANARDASVEAFTVSSYPIVNARGAPVHDLDSVMRLEHELSANLPADPSQAHALVAQRMAALGPELQQRAQQAATGLERAAQVRVERVPAIVFDGRWVVYGVTDVDTARRIYASRARR